jgi:hypothetical protein
MIKKLLLGLCLLPVHAFALNLQISSVQSDDYSINQIQDAVQFVREHKNESRNISIDFAVAKDSVLESDAYPNGDFYFLIGNLDDEWSHQDYNDFYSIAKWLAKEGFRPVINPIAYISDVREAVQNKTTSAVLWDSHGSEDGQVYDSDGTGVPAETFVTGKTASFKYLLFANCYGQASRSFYGITSVKYPASFGWPSTTTSTDLFEYLRGDTFDQQLADSLGIVLKLKDHN